MKYKTRNTEYKTGNGEQRSLHLVTLLVVSLALLRCGPPPRPVPPPATQPASQPASQPVPKKVDPEAFWKGRDDLIKAPAVKPVTALKLPALTRFTLRNGLHVVLLRDSTLPLVSVKLKLKVGSIDDPAGRVGMADYTAYMLRQGVKGLSADAISRKVDMAGASLGAGAGYELTSITCGGRTRVTGMCLKLVADLAMRPTFPKKEMGEIRDKLLGSVKSTRDNPGSLAREHFHNLLYGDDHPAGRPMTSASVRAITRDELVKFHRRHFAPGAAVLGIAGDIDLKKLEQQVRRQLRGWKKRKAPARAVVKVQHPAAGFRVLLVDKPDLSQSFFTLGHAGISRKHPRRDAVIAFNHTLGGGGFSSRLMKVVRSKGGKTYGIRSSFGMSSDDGSFSVASFTRNNQIVATLDLVRKELERIIKEPPTARELAAAKGKIAGGYAIRFQTSAHLISSLLTVHLRGLPETYLTEFPVRIDALSGETVAGAVRALVQPGRLVAAVVGKASEVEPLLKQAKIPYTRVNFLDPISARERKLQAQKPKLQIPAAQQVAARKVLVKALQVAGGNKRLAAVKSLRLAGSFSMGPVKGGMSFVYLLPDHYRMDFRAGPMSMGQVRTGSSGYTFMGTTQKPLSPAQLTQAKMNIFQLPPLLPLHALSAGVKARLSQNKQLTADKRLVAVELFPADLPPLTLVFTRKTHRLARVARMHRGQLQVVRLGGHKKVQGILVPHLLVSTKDGKPGTTLTFNRVEINPRVTKKEITGK